MKRRPQRPTSPDRPDRGLRKGSAGPPRPVATPTAAPDPAGRAATHVAPVGLLAESTAAIAAEVERAVLVENRRADRMLALALKKRRDLAAPDHRFISQAVFALFRWKGWIDPLGPEKIEERLLLATLLDSTIVHAVCRFWARQVGRDPGMIVALGDAPTWAARSEGFRRLLGGRAVTADPWRLFPNWLREHLPLPPGGGPAKGKFVDLLQVLQKRPPLWVRTQGPDEQKTWDELRDLGVKPWVHRRLLRAARLDPDVDVYHLPPFVRGEMEIQDIASQAVAIACDPDPGERWWDACAGAGGKSLHLAALMGGKGLVVATDVHEGRLKEAVRRARKSPFRNLTTKPWDGRHVAGRPGSFDGVLVDAPCSAIGTWRRNPEARWALDRQAIPRLAELQGQILHAASAGVRPGGTLVYSVCTLPPSETSDVVRAFLETHPAFRLDPFPHPFDGRATDGTLQIWPQEADSDAMFLARLVRGAG